MPRPPASHPHGVLGRACPYRLLLGLLAAVLVAGLLAPRADAAPRRAPFGFLGATAGAPLVEGHVAPDRELAVMARSGVESVRLPVYWWHMQREAGGPMDFSRTDPIVAAAARARISVLAVVLGTPAWARIDPDVMGSPPRDPAQYAAVLEALIDRYGPAGTFWRQNPTLPIVAVRDWQIWNEPDNAKYWAPQPFAAGYVELLRVAREAIRARDPGARVVLAGFATPKPGWPVFKRVYGAGARGLFDVAAIHPYTLHPGNVVRLVRLARKRLRRLGDARRPLWATEVTWPASRGHVDSDYGFEVGPRTQARNIRKLLPRLAAERRRLRLERVYWESWITGYADEANPFDYSGLRRHRDGRSPAARPGLKAFRRAARRVQGCAKTGDARRCR